MFYVFLHVILNIIINILNLFMLVNPTCSSYIFKKISTHVEIKYTYFLPFNPSAMEIQQLLYFITSNYSIRRDQTNFPHTISAHIQFFCMEISRLLHVEYFIQLYL